MKHRRQNTHFERNLGFYGKHEINLISLVFPSCDKDSRKLLHILENRIVNNNFLVHKWSVPFTMLLLS